MKVVSKKIKGPKYYSHIEGKYVPGRRTLNRVRCAQIPIKDLPKGAAPAPRSTRKRVRRERKFVNVPVG